MSAYDKSEKTFIVTSPEALNAIAYLKKMHDKVKFTTLYKWLDEQPISEEA